MGDAGSADRRARFARVRVFPLGEEAPDDLVRTTTPAERLRMVWPLTLAAWELARLPVPEYDRTQLKVRVVRSGAARRTRQDDGGAD